MRFILLGLGVGCLLSPCARVQAAPAPVSLACVEGLKSLQLRVDFPADDRAYAHRWLRSLDPAGNYLKNLSRNAEFQNYVGPNGRGRWPEWSLDTREDWAARWVLANWERLGQQTVQQEQLHTTLELSKLDVQNTKFSDLSARNRDRWLTAIDSKFPVVPAHQVDPELVRLVNEVVNALEFDYEQLAVVTETIRYAEPIVSPRWLGKLGLPNDITDFYDRLVGGSALAGTTMTTATTEQLSRSKPINFFARPRLRIHRDYRPKFAMWMPHFVNIENTFAFISYWDPTVTSALKSDVALDLPNPKMSDAEFFSYLFNGGFPKLFGSETFDFRARSLRVRLANYVLNLDDAEIFMREGFRRWLTAMAVMQDLSPQELIGPIRDWRKPKTQLALFTLFLRDMQMQDGATVRFPVSVGPRHYSVLNGENGRNLLPKLNPGAP